MHFNEGKELIRKRQKLIWIAEKSTYGWKVVDEYVSDDLVSGSDDEKRLKKAKEAASRKRRQTNQPRRGFFLGYFVSFSSFGSTFVPYHILLLPVLFVNI